MKKITFLLLMLAINLLQAQVPQSEHDALVALYNATDGPNWTSSSNWNTSNSVSTWYGVTVENINGQDHVTKIKLNYKNLTGNLPVEIGNFPYLRYLSLKSNRLSGSIPNEIGNLTNLRYIHLAYNNLSGSIPSSLGSLSNLRRVYLYNNHLSGAFPDFTSNTNLQVLVISHNDFQFSDLEPNFNAINTLIQSNYGGFYYTAMNPLDTELSYDMVNGSNYTFNMPAVSGTGVTYQWYHNDVAISGATSQTYTITNAQNSDLGDYTCKATSPVIPDLTIDRNVIHLYGTILQSDKDALLALYNTTDGTNWNQNIGWNTNDPVYDWYGISMRGNRVSKIQLNNNELNGNLPPEIGNLTGLTEIHIYGNNQLSGNIPSEIGNLTLLKYLYLKNNNLSGNIPDEIGNLSNLEYINLARNQLSGSIPVGIGNLNNLKYLYLYRNQLSGNIPNEIGNLSNLIVLNVFHNQLTGNIPNTIGNLSNLESFDCSSNALTGTIPSNLSNLTNIYGLFMGNNQLTGDISSLFQNMHKLNYLGMDTNTFTGDVNLSNNLQLQNLQLNNLEISSIDIRNGNNIDISYLNADSNPNLTCIYVDDKNASYLSNWHIGSNSHFVETQAECDALHIDESFKASINVYPNPFTDKVAIEAENAEKIKSISIQNMQGQMVYKGNFAPQIDLANLPTGIYLLNITDKQGNQAVFKLVKD